MADTPNIYKEWGYDLAPLMVAFTTSANYSGALSRVREDKGWV